MGASNNAQPIQSQTAPPAAIAPSGGGGGCGHGGGQTAPPPVAQPQMSQPPMAQASQPPQQSSMPSWFTGNSGGTPAISQPSIGGSINGGHLPMQAASMEGSWSGGDAPAWMNMNGASDVTGQISNLKNLMGPSLGGYDPSQASPIGQSRDFLSMPGFGGGGMMMGPDGQAKAGVMEGGQVMPQTLFSM